MLSRYKIFTFIILSFFLTTNAHTETIEQILSPEETEKICNDFARKYMTISKFYKDNGQINLMENLNNELINDQLNQGELNFLYGIAENDHKKSIEGLQHFILYRILLAEDISNNNKKMEKVTKNMAIDRILKLVQLAVNHKLLTDDTENIKKELINFSNKKDICSKKQF